jgi:hypothetical protein
MRTAHPQQATAPVQKLTEDERQRKRRNAKTRRHKKRRRSGQSWERDPDDWYLEDEWISRRLFDVEPFEGPVRDPFCGCGRVVKSARAHGLRATGADIYQRGFDCELVNFLEDDRRWENVVGNPPYGLWREIIQHALAIADHKVALLLPTGWLHAEDKSLWLDTTPLARIYFLSPRPSIPPGLAVLAGLKPASGRNNNFGWYVWERGHPCGDQWQGRLLRRGKQTNGALL